MNICSSYKMYVQYIFRTLHSSNHVLTINNCIISSSDNVVRVCRLKSVSPSNQSLIEKWKTDRKQFLACINVKRSRRAVTGKRSHEIGYNTTNIYFVYLKWHKPPTKRLHPSVDLHHIYRKPRWHVRFINLL